MNVRGPGPSGCVGVWTPVRAGLREALHRAGCGAFWLAALLLVVVPASADAVAQDRGGTATTLAVPSAEELGQGHLIISVLTVMPGDAIHAEYGHTAFRVRHREGLYDAVFNYGTFDFHNPNFVWEFVKGRLDYALSVESFASSMEQAELEGRPMIEQELNLSAQEAQAVLDFLRWNARREHKHYRYLFFTDNCSTRVRDVLERSVPGLLWAGDAGAVSDAVPDHVAGIEVPAWKSRTYRQMVGVYTADKPWLWAGESTLLGPEADELTGERGENEASVTRGQVRGAMFLPLPLMAVLDASQRATREGSQPLVSRTLAYHWDVPPGAAAAATVQPGQPWPAWVAAAVLLIASFVTLLSQTWGQRRLFWKLQIRNETWWVRLFDAALLMIAGVMGCVMLGLWFFSEHTVAARNAHLVWAWPTHVIAAVVLLSPAAWRNRVGRGLGHYLLAASVAGVVGLIAAHVVQESPLAVTVFALAVAVRCGGRGGRGGRFSAKKTPGGARG